MKKTMISFLILSASVTGICFAESTNGNGAATGGSSTPMDTSNSWNNGNTNSTTGNNSY